MLSRRLTVTLSLLFVSLASCENQGKGAGTDAAVTICDYEVQAIKALNCLCATDPTVAPSDKSEYFRAVCLQNQRIVGVRCGEQQRALAKCFQNNFENGDKAALFAVAFSCDTTVVTLAGTGGSTSQTTAVYNNGDVFIKSTADLCPVEVTALRTCASNPPAGAI
jgi:hypothetical protein